MNQNRSRGVCVRFPAISAASAASETHPNQLWKFAGLFRRHNLLVSSSRALHRRHHHQLISTSSSNISRPTDDDDDYSALAVCICLLDCLLKSSQICTICTIAMFCRLRIFNSPHSVHLPLPMSIGRSRLAGSGGLIPPRRLECP